MAVAAPMAVAVAGADPAARVSQEQKPAARAEKPLKPKPWPLDAETYRERRLEAEALPLFASQDPVDVTLTADWKAVQRDRDDKSKKAFPGTLVIGKGGQPGPPISIELRTRGHVRRNARLCEFAPLRLEFPKDGVKGTVFEGQNNMKLGTHCQSEGVYRQYVLKEFLANRLRRDQCPVRRR